MTSQLIIVGGFLGAGKTTAIVSVATMLRSQAVRVAILINDQGQCLIDGELIRKHGIPVAEMPTGCFCSNFDALLTAVEKLEHEFTPEVILAEPVGFCADLNATVIVPLEYLYRTRIFVRPLTVVVDARRLLAFLRESEERLLTDDLAYLFARQIEEAEFVLLSKCDLIQEGERAFLQNWLRSCLPGVEVLPISDQPGSAQAAWVDRLQLPRPAVASPHPLLDLDYMRYARACTRLAWLNLGGTLTSTRKKSAQHWADALLAALVRALEAADLSVIHVKLFVEEAPGEGYRQLIVGSAFGPNPVTIHWQQRSDSLLAAGGRWLLNARVAGDPTVVEPLSIAVLRRSYAGVLAQIEALASFKPSLPQPQYRYIAGEPPDFQLRYRQHV